MHCKYFYNVIIKIEKEKLKLTECGLLVHENWEGCFVYVCILLCAEKGKKHSLKL